jgi:hypothetical protein
MGHRFFQFPVYGKAVADKLIKPQLITKQSADELIGYYSNGIQNET